MNSRVMKFVDALLECFSGDEIFTDVLYLRHEIRKLNYEKVHVSERSATSLLNSFSNYKMPKVVDTITTRIAGQNLDKWVDFVLDIHKSPS